MTSRLLVLVSFLALLGACGQQDLIDEVQYGMTSAAAVGRAAALTMEAIAGTSTACTVVDSGCTSYPCNGAVTLTLGPSCPLPLGGEASGAVTVTGSWSSVDQSTLSQTYISTRVVAQQNKALAVATVTQLTARRSGTTITVDYTGSNATAGASGGAAAIGAGSSWTVVVDTRGTPDPADDRVTLDASSASGGFGTARATSIDAVVLDPSCRLNPISGRAEITAVSGIIPRIIKIQFHAACDGKAEVNGETRELTLLP